MTIAASIVTLYQFWGDDATTGAFRDCDMCPNMVTVPNGAFLMGSPSHEEGRYGSEGPQHRVSIGHLFAMSAHEVTRQEFEHFVTDTGYELGPPCWAWLKTQRAWSQSEDVGWRDPAYQQDGSHPVACVSWNDALAYAAWLSDKTGHLYRLPSEAEWEYAARGGVASSRYWGDDSSMQCDFANGANDSTDFPWSESLGVECDDGYVGTAPAGTYKPNSFGLYDMMGNVWEWTQDCWNASYDGVPVDGTAWETKGSAIPSFFVS